jgi:mono/diheme cytochrome c family protein
MQKKREVVMRTARERIFTRLRFALGLAAVCLLFVGMPARGQTAPQTQELERLIYSVKGLDLFRAHCAACHGERAKGDGPLAPALKAHVPDLTVLAKNNGGRFPTDSVRKMIVGDAISASHGSREMPIWGPIFHQIEWDQDFGNVRLANLVKYLESIQASASSNAPTAPSASSGAELYAQHCAACHGNELKGSGPAPYPYRTAPDLTTLATRHGGKFPDAYVSNVLREGVVMPAHGPAEMPIWGADFTMDRLGEAEVASRISSLTNYIKSLQEK